MSYAQYDERLDGLGQVIQINTRFRSFVGKPTWTLIIRDIDHGQNIPYLFDIRRGGNHWVAFTYGRNYLITASRLQIETYQSRYNKYKNYRIKNFCNLESNGRIIRGRSMYITIEGHLSPYSNTYVCHVSTYPTGNFYTYHPS
ncbi:MAG: hypothetical protein KIT56_07130 [Gammaproteobacteria bacterium]|nr:hypothetical protein [Gammaproteobacteria bacterium]MCW5583637.1 hypothetical protein [Gammaproteobacteria bacterium]